MLIHTGGEFGELHDPEQHYKDIVGMMKEIAPFAVLLANNDAFSIGIYHAALKLGFPLALLQSMDEQWSEGFGHPPVLALCDTPLPDGYSEVINLGEWGLDNYCLYKSIRSCLSELDKDFVSPSLALMLSTSGSTGSGKMVMLSYDNLRENARQIHCYLGSKAGSKLRSLVNLPISYAYGLSIVNLHLFYEKGDFVVTNRTVLDQELWCEVRRHSVSHFSGVPWTYETLLRIGLSPIQLPIKVWTQAGGKLSPSRVVEWATRIKQDSFFYTMYGQTEATARILYNRSELTIPKPHTLSNIVDKGAVFLRPLGDSEDTELIYKGNNVMLGYAESLLDLRKGDELGGELSTGDLVRMDDDGHFEIVGRIKRIIKMAGKRINLADIETRAEGLAGCACLVTGRDEQSVLVQVEDRLTPVAIAMLKVSLSSYSGILQTRIMVETGISIPRNGFGKKVYAAFRF